MVVSTTPVGAALSSVLSIPLKALTKVDFPTPLSPVTAMFSEILFISPKYFWVINAAESVSFFSRAF